MILALFVLAAASLEPPARGGSHPFAPAPDEGCIEASQAPGATPGPGQSEPCVTAGGGSGAGGAGTLGSVLPLVALVVAGVLAIAAIGAVLVVRSQPPRGVPEPVEGWWTCPTCGASNLAEAARCHKCGAWQPASGARPGGRTAL
jgi:hypothetical protein